MATVTALTIVTMAGVANGSFAVPSKSIQRWTFENLWLQFALWTFLILPWAFSLSQQANVLHLYQQAPLTLLRWMIVGGLLFGVGQVCFTVALSHIGIGLAFLLNIGLGTTLGTFIPFISQHSQQILTPFGLANTAGTLMTLAGLVLCYMAGQLRDKEKNAATAAEQKNSLSGLTGVILALTAGIMSAVQNITFATTAPLQSQALAMGFTPLTAANAMWPGFLLASFLPYSLYMLCLLNKNKTFAHYLRKNTYKYWAYALFMSVFWYGSLILYSQASLSIGALGPVIGWPIFMGLIILTSNFWGWYHGEWHSCGRPALVRLIAGASLMLIGISSLGYSAYLATV